MSYSKSSKGSKYFKIQEEGKKRGGLKEGRGGEKEEGGEREGRKGGRRKRGEGRSGETGRDKRTQGRRKKNL